MSELPTGGPRTVSWHAVVPERPSGSEAAKRRRRHVRDWDEYPNYPENSRFLWYPEGSECFWLWEDFLTGKTDEEPPVFLAFLANKKKKEDRDPRLRLGALRGWLCGAASTLAEKVWQRGEGE
jgi:hypothetical protein